MAHTGESIFDQSGSEARALLSVPEEAEVRIHVGARIRLHEDWTLDSNTCLEKGVAGVVAQIDEEGDALVRFSGHPHGVWVPRWGFQKLEVLEKGVAVTLCINISILVAVLMGAVAGACGTEKIHVVETETVRQLIEQPRKMFEAVGFVSAPLIVVSAKGLFNFGVQMLLYLEGAVLNADVAREKLREDLRLSKASISFQVIGLATTAHAYAKLTCILTPWASWTAFCMFALAISQHTATMTLVVSLITTLVYVDIIEDVSRPAEHSEQSVARWLVMAGVLVGMPLWLVLAGTLWLQLPFIVAAAAVLFSALLGLLMLEKEDFTLNGAKIAMKGIPCLLVSSAGSTAARLRPWSILLWLCIASLVFAWLVAAILQREAWLLAEAAIVEMVGPLAILVLVLVGFLEIPAFPQLAAYVVSVQCLFFVVIAVPAALLALEGGVGIAGGAPVAVAGKQLRPFLQFSFQVDAGTHGAASPWLSQLVSLFS